MTTYFDGTNPSCKRRDSVIESRSSEFTVDNNTIRPSIEFLNDKIDQLGLTIKMLYIENDDLKNFISQLQSKQANIDASFEYIQKTVERQNNEIRDHIDTIFKMVEGAIKKKEMPAIQPEIQPLQETKFTQSTAPENEPVQPQKKKLVKKIKAKTTNTIAPIKKLALKN